MWAVVVLDSESVVPPEGPTLPVWGGEGGPPPYVSVGAGPTGRGEAGGPPPWGPPSDEEGPVARPTVDVIP